MIRIGEIALEWEYIAENELHFYVNHQEYIAEINDRLIELEKDIRYPSSYIDHAKHEIRSFVPTVEHEVLRREEAREALEKGLQRIYRKAERIHKAYIRLNEVETTILSEGANELRTYRRVLRKFYLLMAMPKAQDRRQQELQHKLDVLYKNGLGHSTRAKKLLEQVG
jgi:hypothetical protein